MFSAGDRAGALTPFRLPRLHRLARTVEGDRLANERLEGGLVNFFSFVDVDRAACVSVETRVEETGRILQRRALEERQLHDVLVGLACAYQSVVGPDRDAPALPCFDNSGVGLLDQGADPGKCLAAPVAQPLDLRVYQARW